MVGAHDAAVPDATGLILVALRPDNALDPVKLRRHLLPHRNHLTFLILLVYRLQILLVLIRLLTLFLEIRCEPLAATTAILLLVKPHEIAVAVVTSVTALDSSPAIGSGTMPVYIINGYAALIRWEQLGIVSFLFNGHLLNEIELANALTNARQSFH